MMEQQPPLVMVVDDDRLVLATLCAGLRQAGIEVIEADNGPIYAFSKQEA